MTPSILDNLVARKHWVFDLDGTLTVPVHDFNAIRSRLGVPADSDILGHLDSLPREASRTLHATLQEIEDELAKLTSAANGALQLLEQLRLRGAHLGILTRNTRKNALRTLTLIGLDGYFEPEHILGRDDAAPKPDPDGICHLINLWEARPESTVMVGDYLFDLQAGRSAGTATVHVDVDRAFRWPELTDLGVASLQELSNRIESARDMRPGVPVR